MKNVQNIINATNPSAIVLGENTVKAMYGKRQVVVSYNESTDLFSVWAFTLSGVKFSKEVKFDGVFVDNLKQIINEAI